MGVAEESRKSLTFGDRWKLNRSPLNSYLITMFFSNGTSRSWVIKTKEETFTYRKRTYYLRYEDALYDISHGAHHLFFHEDHPVPIDREIKREGEQNWFSVTPHNLKPLMSMEEVTALVSSTELNKYLRMLVIICGILLLFTLANLGMLISLMRGGK